MHEAGVETGFLNVRLEFGDAVEILFFRNAGNGHFSSPFLGLFAAQHAFFSEGNIFETLSESRRFPCGFAENSLFSGKNDPVSANKT